MSMFRIPAGLPALLKEGTRHYQGEEEAIYRNIDAVKKMCEVLESAYGPTGMSKLVNNFLDKRFLTSDATTVLSELEIQHPAAKIVVLAAQMQNTEFGDATNFVALLANELLQSAQNLMRQESIPLAFVIQGYELALNRILSRLTESVVLNLEQDLHNRELVSGIFRPVLGTKIKNPEDKLIQLIIDGCMSILPHPGSNLREYNTDNLRVTKVVGGTLTDSFLVNGLVLPREPKTACKQKTNCKICVLATALEITGTEGTSTVLLKKAEDLLSFSKGEEEEMENFIKSFHDAGVEALICGGAISPLALHYLDKYNMWALATPSKFDIKRYCRTLRVPALQRINPPTAEEIGLAEFAGIEEHGSELVTVVRGKDTKVSTIVLRGPTKTCLDEVERAIDDCVSLMKACTKDARFLPGGAAIECALAEDLSKYAQSLTGLTQYAVKEFANSLMTFPKIIAENAGQNAMETIALLQAQHQGGKTTIGVNVTSLGGSRAIRDVTKELTYIDPSSAFEDLKYPVYDHLLTKEWALRLAVNAALTILRVDQIIMSKPAGGPKMPNQGHWDAADDRAPAF